MSLNIDHSLASFYMSPSHEVSAIYGNDPFSFILGLLTSTLGYMTQILIYHGCYGAGFEMAGSSFMAYNIWTGSSFSTVGKILAPLPELAQIGASGYFMYACIAKTDTNLADHIVNYIKVVQGFSATYSYLTAFDQSLPGFDPFMGAFAFVKQLFNLGTATYYFTKEGLE